METINNDNKIIHGLWIGGSLGPLELLCIHSFLNAGHIFWLWVYKSIANLPEHVVLMDANNILPESKIFSYNHTNKFGHGKNSYAGFSDIFRYKLLYEYGGWWTDMDVTCLKPLQFESTYIFKRNGSKGVVGNIIKCPSKSNLMKYCYEQSITQINQDSLDWMLPINILNTGISNYKLDKYIRNLSNEDSWPLVVKYLITNIQIQSEWYIIHWMNEEWRRHGLNKTEFIKDSVCQKLLSKNHIQHNIILGKSALKIKLKLSKWNYRYTNLIARIKWILMKL